MKKVLMVMGFALCASIAFAQTTRISAKDDVKKSETVSVTKAKAAVDYKASIFGKANGHDTIQVFKFDNAADYTVGVLATSDRINDTIIAMNAHDVSGDNNRWVRYANLSAFRSAFATSGLYGLNPNIGSWIAEDMDPAISPREPQDDGFMFLSYWETNLSRGHFNTYFTLPIVQRPAEALMIEVSLTQSYRKYYDRCFIDYKVNDKWWTREINVTGVDVEVNGWGPTKARFVMPHKLNETSNIELRVRAYSNHRGSAFGYFWAIDNVAVMALTLNQYWALNSPTKIDGFYGMVPQGMTIPLTYGIEAHNLSVGNIPNAKVTVNAGATRNDLAEVFSGATTTVQAGSIDSIYPIVLNERGFYNPAYSVTHGYQSWYNTDGSNYGNTTGTLTGGYQGRGLPASTLGKNYYSLNVSGGNLSRDYDTILYYVTDELSFAAGSTREGGYRWAHDNGVIPSGAVFSTCFTDPDPDYDDQYFVTDDGFNPENGAHCAEAGYAVHVRYTTGNDIPQGWVFRGLEIIAATDREISDIEGSSIVPITYRDEYETTADGSTLHFNSLACGIDGLAFEVQENEINDQLYSMGGYILPSEGYKAINIQFVEQPAILPNTSYRFGYRLNQAGQFAVAGTRNSFRFINDTGATVNVGFGYGVGANDTLTQYANAAAAVNDYRYIDAPATYLDIIAYDPIVNDNVYGWNIDNYPMIRPIVGPARPVETATLEGDCEDNTNDHGVMISRSSDEFCNGFLEVTANSQQRIDFTPIGDYSVIDSVLLDGVKLEEYNEDLGIDGYYTGEYNVWQDPENETGLLLQRDYWVYYMGDLAANSQHVFKVYSHYEEHNIIGIDPVAPEVSLGIAPNPATSTVKVNVKGITGMVNCSILDMSGRVIYNANINAENEHMINVSNIPAGAYFVRVTNDTFSKIEKLIVK